MELNEFHKVYRDYLIEKSMDTKLITALESGLEKWFQGEMVLAFTKPREGLRVFSGQEYNNYCETNIGEDSKDNWKEGDWEKMIEESGIVTIEGNVYKNVKTSKKEATGKRSVDFLLETRGEYIFSEIKFLWLDKAIQRDTLYTHLERAGVLEDAWRLKKNLLNEYRNGSKDLRLYLTLICVGDIGKMPNVQKDLGRVLEDYLEENDTVGVEKIKVGRISEDGSNQLARVVDYCDKKDSDGLDYLNNIFLITVDLGS
jgi:hypothetical protein